MSNITRRQFVKGAAAFGAAASIGFPRPIRAQGMNEKLQVGFVAVGGRAGAHTDIAPEPIDLDHATHGAPRTLCCLLCSE